MAKRKKSRTPAPPKRPAAPRSDGRAARQVQAPQVRTKRRTQEETERRNRTILYSVAGAGIVGLAAALIAVFAIGRGGGGPPAPDNGPSVDFANLPGLIKTAPPWTANITDLKQRLDALGLPPLSQEGQVLHIHQHLDIFVNGKHITVPAGIGINQKQNFISDLHTHDTSGIVHVESQEANVFSLGQFFGVWGLNLSSTCVGGLCFPPGPFNVYVNGKAFTSNPVTMVLQAHQEIAIVYGKPPGKIPSSYTWQPGQ